MKHLAVYLFPSQMYIFLISNSSLLVPELFGNTCCFSFP